MLIKQKRDELNMVFAVKYLSLKIANSILSLFLQQSHKHKNARLYYVYFILLCFIIKCARNKL